MGTLTAVYPRIFPIACRIVVIGLLSVTGCTTASNLDGEPGLARDHILARRYVIDADGPYPIAKVHFFFTFEAQYPRYGQIALAKGTIVQVKHVESISSTDIDYGEGVAQMQAFVLNGPHKGKRISVGSINDYNSKFAESTAVDAPSGLEKSSGDALSPLPDHAPDWLDVDHLPPAVKPVDSTVLRQALADPDWVIRFYALRELIRRDPSDPRTVQECVAALADDVSELRNTALDGLQIQKNAQPDFVLAALVQRYSDPLELYSEAERIADLIAATGPRGLQAVDPLLASHDGGIVQRAANIMRDNAAIARPYLSHLVAAVHRDYYWQSEFDNDPAYDAVKQIDFSTAVSIALEAFRIQDPDARAMVIYELERLDSQARETGDTQSHSAIVAALNNAVANDVSYVRDRAQQALDDMKPREPNPCDQK
jgi:hypothetical protein